MIYAFAGCEFDVERHELTRQGELDRSAQLRYGAARDDVGAAQAVGARCSAVPLIRLLDRL